ncbi:MAG: FMN-binding protein [Chloroflexi bacterium]|nr:FMN-binding protein [Chloroflexota bacterium]
MAAVRKYLQLLIVVTAFFTAVAIRHLRQPAIEPESRHPTVPPAYAGTAQSEALPLVLPVPVTSTPLSGSALSSPLSVGSSGETAPAVVGSARTPTPDTSPATATEPTSPVASRGTTSTPTVITSAAVGDTSGVAATSTDAIPVVDATPPVEPSPSPVRPVARVPTLFDGSSFRDGAFTGKEIRTTYGTMQVQVVMKDGRIADVTPVQIPTRTGTSASISEKTVPTYVAQAIASEDWDVDLITGATVTWEAFKRAMVYALRAAE